MRILLCLLILGWGTARAAEGPRKLSDFPPPRAPFVQAVPEKAIWVIVPRVLSEDEGNRKVGKPQARVSGIESFRYGDLKRDLVTYASGAREEVWYVRDQVLTAPSTGSGRVRVQSAAVLDEPGDAKGAFRLVGNPVKASGYPGFKWLDRTHYSGLVLFDKTVPSYHYVLKGRDPDSGDELVVAEAWVNAETGAPVAFTSEGALYVYEFRPPPSQPLALPSAFESAYRRVRQERERQQRLEADAAALR